ncbi:MAG: AraC family transcriptional regulator [Paenibacillaceae bacterium]|nr:AraC family transcriptional regulator [Paenibacillaceae bacterium]
MPDHVRTSLVPLEKLNINLRIGPLLFDLLLDAGFFPVPVAGGPGKHNHYAYELQCFVAGSGMLYVDRRAEGVPLRSPSVHLIGPGCYHSFVSDPNDPLRRFYIQFLFREDSGASDMQFPLPEATRIRDTLAQTGYAELPDPNPVLALAERIKDEFTRAEVGYYAEIQSLFAQLIVRLVRALRPEQGDYPLPARNGDDLRTRTIEIYLNDGQNHPTVEGLAALLNVSTKQAGRIIRRFYGVSFKQKLHERRLEVAKHHLLDGSLPIAHIAERVGYSSERAFVRWFAKRTGVTPAQFRKTSIPTQIV